MTFKYSNCVVILVTLLPILVVQIESEQLLANGPTSLNQCIRSVTTTSGKNAPTGDLCSGQLILDENFDDFDRNRWEHEITMGGGGVSIEAFKWHNNRISYRYIICSSRMGNSSGMLPIRKMHTYKMVNYIFVHR